MTSTIVVSGADLTKRFGSQLAVDALDLAVPKGECFGLLGPNGAGKTTTLRMVYGVTRPDSGQIMVFGLDVAREGRRVRGRLGVTLQENVLIDSLSAAENLRVFGRYHLLRETELARRVDALIDQFELGSQARVPAIALSGGFKRRLAIAMALINEPELLILDEPTTGLDPAVRLVLWNKVRELKARGTTVLLTTHYMEEAERLCDRVLIMSAGRKVLEGAPRALVQARLAREALELDCTPEEEARLLAGLPGAKSLRAGPRLFVFGEHAAPLVERVKQLIDGDARQFVVRPANLEDLFLAATGTRLEAGA
jgi:lipooligosaccharide transport system ATP-binding protein